VAGGDRCAEAGSQAEEEDRNEEAYPGARAKEGAGMTNEWHAANPAEILDDIAAYGHVLTPGRYVGAEDVEDDGEVFEEKMQRLTATLEEQFTESVKLEDAIRLNLSRLLTAQPEEL
jgi:type I restriction enzyme M protein